MKFYTSDHHFQHNNILKFCNRPFRDMDHMTEILIMRWNERVSPTDTVYYLGDFTCNNLPAMERVSHRLNGIKRFVAGNHDPCHSMHKDGKAIARFEAAGWKLEDEALRVEIQGTPFLLCHFPYTNEGEQYVRYQDLRPINEGRWLLHGHVHEQWKVKDRMINVGVDVWDFYPVSEDEIMEIVSRS